jgi:hypothetical protein
MHTIYKYKHPVRATQCTALHSVIPLVHSAHSHVLMQEKQSNYNAPWCSERAVLLLQSLQLRCLLLLRQLHCCCC